jgi:hypothetical protein
MRKIRRFKIPVHLREIYRRAARFPDDLAAAGLPSEKEFFEFVSVLAAEIEPGVVFDSYGKDCAIFTGLDIPQNRMFSAGITTLGPRLEAKIASLEVPAARKIAAIAAFEFMECAVDLIDELVTEEAAKENFVLTDKEVLLEPSLPPSVPSDGAYRPRFLKNAKIYEGENRARALAALLEAVNAAKINVFFADGQPNPRLTTALLVPWLSRKKKGK